MTKDPDAPLGKYKTELVGVLPEEAGGQEKETDLPEAKAHSEINVGEFVIRAIVLADGRRIIEQKSFDLFLAYLASGGPMTVDDATRVEKFLKGFSL